MIKAVLILALLALLALPSLQQVKSIPKDKDVVEGNVNPPSSIKQAAEQIAQKEKSKGSPKKPQTPRRGNRIDLASAAKNSGSPSKCFPNGWCWFKYTHCDTFYCPQNGYWFSLGGFAVVSITVQPSGAFLGTTFLYGGKSFLVKPKDLQCGCNCIQIWVYAWHPWWFWPYFPEPSTSCINQCHSNNPGALKYFDYGTCRCKCKPECCVNPSWWVRPQYPDPTCNCRPGR